jgi:hypothetical protein
MLWRSLDANVSSGYSLLVSSMTRFAGHDYVEQLTNIYQYLVLIARELPAPSASTRHTPHHLDLLEEV